MKIMDITQELFSCAVYPGDEPPVKKVVESIDDGSICNLTAFSMCAHNGTHVDAPYHFYKNGKTIDQMDLSAFIGKCYVAHSEGDITAEKAEAILEKASKLDPEAAGRILIGGNVTVTIDAAKVFSKAGIVLIGNESQTVGPIDAPAQVHYELLGAGIVLLEGIRLSSVKEGVYLLNAAPLNLGGCDGAPCRAVLIEK